MRVILIIALTALAALPMLGQESADTAIRHTHVYLNIRSGPSTAFDLVGLARPCRPIEVIEPSGEWFKIKRGSGDGYVAGWFTHAGPPHCGDEPAALPAQQPAQSGATASNPPPAPTATSQPQDNKCFGDWTWCSVSDPDETTFWWNLGWCIAGIEAGSRGWTPEACMGRLGTPLPANFNIPGYSPAQPTQPAPADSDDSDDDEVSCDPCDPSGACYNYGPQCYTDF